MGITDFDENIIIAAAVFGANCLHLLNDIGSNWRVDFFHQIASGLHLIDLITGFSIGSTAILTIRRSPFFRVTGFELAVGAFHSIFSTGSTGSSGGITAGITLILRLPGIILTFFQNPVTAHHSARIADSRHCTIGFLGIASSRDIVI